MKTMQLQQFNEQQSLHAVNSQQLYSAWLDAQLRALDYRYGLTWKTAKGRQYLFRLRDRKGNGRSLGPRNPETERIYDEFYAGKSKATQNLSTINDVMDQQKRLNRAVNINRLPTIVGDILRALDIARLTDQFKVVGTHCLYAYEAHAGIFFPSQTLATGDVDLLFDRRAGLSIVAQKLDKQGLLGLLQSVDKTFTVSGKRYTAVNAQGFMVDLITTTQDMRESESVAFSQNDLVAGEIPGLQWLINAPRFQSIAVDHSGMPASMNVPDPRAFALHKIWISQQASRNPIKAIRDASQAKFVAKVVSEHIPTHPFSETLTSVHQDVRDLLPELGIDTRESDSTSNIENFLRSRSSRQRPG